MIAPATLGLLALVVLGTSFLSGIFGMAGGIVLLGTLLLVLDVAPAMVLFGSTQMAANGWRSLLWRAHVKWPIVGGYIVGALAAFAVMRLVVIVPSKGFMYLALGAMPFLADIMPKRLEPDITRPGMPYVCGLLLMVINLLAGATGTLLDVLFQKSTLDRKSIVATKAVTQTFSHLLRIFYFGSLTSTFSSSIPWWVYAGAVIPALVGTSLAARVLEAMTDADFRRWARRIIATVSATFVVRGAWMIVAGAG